MDDQSTKVLAAILAVAIVRWWAGIEKRQRERPRHGATYTQEQAAAWARYFPPDRPQPPSLEARTIAAARRVGSWWGRHNARRRA